MGDMMGNGYSGRAYAHAGFSFTEEADGFDALDDAMTALLCRLEPFTQWRALPDDVERFFLSDASSDSCQGGCSLSAVSLAKMAAVGADLLLTTWLDDGLDD